MNKNPIDIIIPFVNPNDDVWKKDFLFWKEKETGNKDDCRFIDWGMLNYVFRSIDENCPWVRYVFLVLAQESQIPTWVNKDCNKIKIIYHKDYIPRAFLPTFNSNTIELFYWNIKELSDNFILINDDMFFWNKTKDTDWFDNDLPKTNSINIKKPKKTMWDMTLWNGIRLLNKNLKLTNDFRYDTKHIPVSYKKSLQSFFIYKNKDVLYDSITRFRTEKNLTHFMFYDLQILLKKCIINEINGKNYPIRSDDFKIDESNVTICLNENEYSTKEDMLYTMSLLQKKFPKKCAFEK